MKPEKPESRTVHVVEDGPLILNDSLKFIEPQWNPCVCICKARERERERKRERAREIERERERESLRTLNIPRTLTESSPQPERNPWRTS